MAEFKFEYVDMSNFYTAEKSAQVVIALLKSHGIRKVIASPGGTNMVLVGSMQNDPFFEMYSSVDERSAAYIACGLAAESEEPVAISCTGATSSRNYLPGLTEAYYRKLPVLAITSTQAVSKVGHHVAQVIDRSAMPKDVAKLSLQLPIIKDADDYWECEVKVNEAILELKRQGGGPVHINLPTVYSQKYDIKELPKVRVIERIYAMDAAKRFPELLGKVAVFIGNHKKWSQEETDSLDRFCAANNAVVFCDHTSAYKGDFRLQYALVAAQETLDISADRPDILIHIGEVTGDYASLNLKGRQVWRVSEDGKVRDTFRALRYVFEMPETCFFEHYTPPSKSDDKTQYLDSCKNRLEALRKSIPELPYSNIWIASKMARRIPDGSTIHFGILNSLRSWNFYDLPRSVSSSSNTGGFGIDGGLSSFIGASFSDRSKLYFCVIGDLAFFYDMNVLGNRHIGNNLRILLVNNGKGTEFRNYGHHGAKFGQDGDEFIAAAGHFGNKSDRLVQGYTESLGFEYSSASNKKGFEEVFEQFLVPEVTEKPMVLEVFTDSELESEALEKIQKTISTPSVAGKKMVKKILGEKTSKAINAFVKK